MSGERTCHTCRGGQAARVGVLSALALAIVGFLLLGLRGGRAEAANLSPDGVAGYQTTEKLLVTIALNSPEGKPLQGALQIELLADGKTFAQDQKRVDQAERAVSYRFELPVAKHAPEQITLRCRFGKEQFEVPLSKVLVVKAHETSLASSQEFFAGSTASLRCGVHGVKSLTENVPLVGAEVSIQLRGKDGKVYPLHTDKTGANGIAEARFQVPALPAGQYTLEVATKSNLGAEKLSRDVRIKTDPKILLVTDKPLYQPGQMIHIRALALQSYDMTPVAGKSLVFEVEDAKGNKVFKKALPTSDFGVAAVDFQLADEVNMGDYRIRAILGDAQANPPTQADKTVAVKRYVLPKFKTDVKADKRFYLPKETMQVDVQSDYFFGKPVAAGKVTVKASTFDVQFKEFHKWEGTADKAGHAKLEIKLPDYFVGQPLQKGNALVKLEVKITDAADHSETLTRTYPVSDQAIKVSLIPEGGRLVPGIENRVFAAAIYPDGSPVAGCDVNLWLGQKPTDRSPWASVKTNDAGLAEFKLTPKKEQLRQGEHEQRNVEMLGGSRPVWSPKILFDIYAEAKDPKGNRAQAVAAINSDLLGENVLLRLDKAIYKGGDTLQINVHTSAGLPTAYVDVIRGGQTLLSSWLDVKEGKATQRLDLPSTIFGTLEVHAYQMLASGEIIRDSRVVYVHPPADLKIDIQPDKKVHLPGEEGKIRFQVTDAAGKPTVAALGVIIVDEAVYALQEMQPGLEKVYFTLQEELLKPQAQAVYRPSESIDTLVREPELLAGKQQIAQVLLTAIKPKPPTRWDVSPSFERRQQVEGQVQQIAWSLYSNAANTKTPFMEFDPKADRWQFKPGLLDELAKAKVLNPQMLTDPFGKKWTLEELSKLEKDFTVDRLARAVTLGRLQQLTWTVVNYSQQNQAKWLKNGKWELPDTVIGDGVKQQRLDALWLKDAWGEPIKLLKVDKKREHQTGWTQFDYHELVSAGPDRKFGTADDVKMGHPNQWHMAQWWWLESDKLAEQGQRFGMRDGRFAGRGGGMREELLNLAMPQAAPAVGAFAKNAAKGEDKKGPGPSGAGAAPVRVREYFPETMLWQPALITDAQGRAELPLTFADSITTWRLSASASTRGGLLGGVSAPLRVFQDFFVDLDLPVTLTQNDEVAFPVAVYNYLKDPQTVKLELEPADWFELIDTAGLSRSLDLRPNEVTAVKFRIKARKIGVQPLTVKASGSKMSDAIKRSIEVVPDGNRIEIVASDRLAGRVAQTITIPENSIPDSYKILVKVYPGIMSQVLEGTEGMLRLPGG